jgi:hypothetical protein
MLDSIEGAAASSEMEGSATMEVRFGWINGVEQQQGDNAIMAFLGGLVQRRLPTEVNTVHFRPKLQQNLETQHRSDLK